MPFVPDVPNTGFIDPDKRRFIDPDELVGRTGRFVPDVPDSFDAAKHTSEANTGKFAPVNAGIANLVASGLGLPMETLKNLTNLGIAGYGAIKGLAGGMPPDLIESLPGDISNARALFNRAARESGIAGLSTGNPSPESKVGTAAYELASRGGFIPGSALPAIGSMIGEKIGGTPGAIIGSMVPGAAIQTYNELRAPSLAASQAQNVVRDRTLQKAQDAGYKTIPSSVTDNPLGKTLESFAGKSAVKDELALSNQHTTNRLVREELNAPSKGINVPPNTPLTEDLLQNLRDQASIPYKAIASLSPLAAKALERLKDVRSQANDQWKYYDAQSVPEAKRKAIALDNQATVLESFLDKQARRSGQPQLVPELRQAREYIAKTYDIDRALNLGNGNVDAKIIGRALDRGRPLSGNLETIAKFAEGPGKQVTTEASKVSPPGVGGLTWPLAAALGVEGTHYLGPYGAAMAALPFARGGVRSLVTSDAYQNAVARPDYSPAMQPTPAGSLPALLMQTYGK